MTTETLPPRPSGHKYYGPLEPATLTDGWCYGYITQAPCEEHPEGCESGDGYVVAPDGYYAGLIWRTDCPWTIEPAEGGAAARDTFFGVFEVRFARPVVSLEDLVSNFRDVLPLLQERHAVFCERSEMTEPDGK